MKIAAGDALLPLLAIIAVVVMIVLERSN